MAQHSIVQEKLVGHNASRGITFQAVLWYRQGLSAITQGQRAGSAGCSVAGSLLRRRRGRCPGRLAAQVGAGDDAGQDAQPLLHLRSLLGGVLRRRSRWGLLAASPRFSGVPARPRRSVLSRLVSHILSLVACDRVSVYSCGIAMRIISFTSHRFGSAACSPTPLVSVTPTGPLAFGLSPAVRGVYSRLSSGMQPPDRSFQS